MDAPTLFDMPAPRAPSVSFLAGMLAIHAGIGEKAPAAVRAELERIAADALARAAAFTPA